MQFISNYNITINGTLVEWEVYLVRVAEVELQVWREENDRPLTFNLVNELHYKFETAGFHKVSSSMEVRAGDVLGWYHHNVLNTSYTAMFLLIPLSAISERSESHVSYVQR